MVLAVKHFEKTMQRLFYIFLGLGAFVIGGFLWIALQRERGQSSGNVLGAIHDDGRWNQPGVLLSAGTDGDQLALWEPQTGLTEFSPLAGTSKIHSAVRSTDHRWMLVAQQQGTFNTLWLLENRQAPVLVGATRGRIDSIQFSPDTRFAAYREVRTEGGISELVLVDLSTKMQRRVAQETRSFVWAPDSLAMLSMDFQGQVWYHTLGLSGSIDPPQLLGSSRSNPAALKNDQMLFIVQQEDGLNLLRFDIRTKISSLVTPVSEVLPEEYLRLSVSPDEQKALIIAQFAADQQNGNLYLVQTSTGETKKLEALAKQVAWFDENRFLYERVVGSKSELWFYQVTTNETSRIAQESIHLLL